MKKRKRFVILFIVIFILLIGNISYGSKEDNSQKLLYQDATINADGSITVKEALWLNGNYNGSERKIEFSKYNSYPFTGIYSNFSGDSDIYNAKEITDIKVYDISQAKFSSMNDMQNVEKEFKKVESASKGKYGVYTVDNGYRNTKIKIYCPARKKKVFYIEYTIKDAVVVHNDIAELYWCFVENESQETILDYQLKVHLPQEDKELMVWSHGPASGYCNIDDYQTLSLKDNNILPYKFETMRVMFNKSLVPEATKKSNVNGKEYIIKYEKAMEDPEKAIDENKKIDIENQLSEAFVKLNTNPSIYWYNSANKLLQKYTWDDEQKQKYQIELENSKEAVNQDWKESVEWEYNFMIKYNSISQYRIENLISKIDEGFDENAKIEYYEKAEELQKQLDANKLRFKQNLLKIVVIIYFLLGVICILVVLKIFLEKKRFNKKYYRDFPSEDKAYVIDYLMNKKISGKTFVVTILDLIFQKKITVEKSHTCKNDFNLILNEYKSSNTTTENCVIEILFDIVGSNNTCSLEQLKKYRKSKSNSSKIISKLNKFEKSALKEIKYKEYFKTMNISTNLLLIVVLSIFVFGYISGFFINENGYISLLNYYILITVFSFIYYKILKLDKGRTKKGQLEYSKWLAHKRFLKDFGRFDQKELPEIILWEKYLVTATILGCSEKVLKQMKININTYEGLEDTQKFMFKHMYYQEMRQLNNNFNSLINKAHIKDLYNSSSSSSGGSSSSGSGFGGGSSSGGSGGGGGGWSRF